MMQEQFKIILQIWCQVWWMSTNKASKTKLWIYLSLLPLLSLFIGIAVIFLDSNVKRVWIFPLVGILINIVLMLCFGFIFLCEIAKMQYSPANAKLLPHIKRHLQLALAVPLFIFPLIALFTQSLIENELRIGAWIFVVFAMLSNCISIRSPWGLPLFILSIQFPRFEQLDYLKPMMASNNIKLLMVVLSFLLIIIVLRWAFAMGEKEIFNLEKRNFKGLLNQSNLKNTGLMSQFFNSPYLMWMNLRIKKISTLAKSNKASIQIFGLAPNAHWITNFFTMMSIVFFVSAFIVVIEFFESYGTSSIKSWSDFSLGFLMVVVPFMSIIYVLNFSVTIYNCRREHGLLQLVPFGLKNANLQKLSDSLLRDFCIQFFVFWSVGLCVSLYLAINADFTSKQITTVILGNLSLMFSSLAVFHQQNKRENLYDPKLLLFVLLALILFAISISILFFVGIYLAWAFAFSLIILYGLCLKYIFSLRKKDEIMFPAGRAV